MKLVDIIKGIEYESPEGYIHWMDRTSVGIWNYLRLTFRSEDEYVDCHLPSGSFFGFWNPQASNVTKLDYIRNQGELHGDKYWHHLYILTKIDEPGEFIEHLYIGNNKLLIGIPVEEQDETLYINLANKGFEVSPTIQKALYDQDYYETNPNYVVLNNKFKELLLNYMDVLGNKGSYKSLINSLKWFEYGDLVTIEQVWKHDNKYLSRPISQEITGDLLDLRYKCNKTTSVVLRCLDYRHDRWTKNEMRIKMYLLGKYFEAYFLPIHMELLYSAVEDTYKYDIITNIGIGYQEKTTKDCNGLRVQAVYNGITSTTEFEPLTIYPKVQFKDGTLDASVVFNMDKKVLVKIDGKVVANGTTYTHKITNENTKPHSVQFIDGNISTHVIVRPKDNLNLDLGVFNVTINTDTYTFMKPKSILKATVGDKPHIVSNVFDKRKWIYISPKTYTDLSPRAFKLYDKVDTLDLNYHYIDGKYLVNRPFNFTEDKKYDNNSFEWVWPEYYYTLTRSEGASTEHEGVLVCPISDGIPIDISIMNASITQEENEYGNIQFKLQYTFGDDIYTIRANHKIL